MHEMQRKLLSLIDLEDISKWSYRQIAERVGSPYAAQVKHHLDQLVSKRLVARNAAGKLIALNGQRSGSNTGSMVMIPVLGEADCGEATKYATGEIDGYLALSPGVIKSRATKDYFALRARGSSMNSADIDGKAIEDGDYVLVKKVSSGEALDGKYVVSIIQGLANIKRFRKDDIYRRVVLTSESFDYYPPIIIAQEDLADYQISGQVVEVVKGVDGLR